jgi:hypothetical protein
MLDEGFACDGILYEIEHEWIVLESEFSSTCYVFFESEQFCNAWRMHSRGTNNTASSNDT